MKIDVRPQKRVNILTYIVFVLFSILIKFVFPKRKEHIFPQ